MPGTQALTIPRPERTEAAPYYFRYIDQVAGNDVIAEMEQQLVSPLAALSAISEERSLYRYAPDKWSIREVLNHISDAERVFSSRALWFARGFDAPLPSFEQDVASRAAAADEISWSAHLDEFRLVHAATISLFKNMPQAALMHKGTASGNPFTVRALAYVIAGHFNHHWKVLQEKYLEIE